MVDKREGGRKEGGRGNRMERKAKRHWGGEKERGGDLDM